VPGSWTLACKKRPGSAGIANWNSSESAPITICCDESRDYERLRLSKATLHAAWSTVAVQGCWFKHQMFQSLLFFGSRLLSKVSRRLKCEQRNAMNIDWENVGFGDFTFSPWRFVGAPDRAVLNWAVSINFHGEQDDKPSVLDCSILRHTHTYLELNDFYVLETAIFLGFH